MSNEQPPTDEALALQQIEAQHEKLQTEINKLSPGLGIVDPQTARILLISGAELQFDAEGNPTNVPALLEQLVKSKPFLAAPRDGRALYQAHRRGPGLNNPNLWKK